jgi:hypothetical protein
MSMAVAATLLLGARRIPPMRSLHFSLEAAAEWLGAGGPWPPKVSGEVEHGGLDPAGCRGRRGDGRGRGSEWRWDLGERRRDRYLEHGGVDG